MEAAQELMTKALGVLALIKGRATETSSSEYEEPKADAYFRAERQGMGIDCMECGNKGYIVYELDGYQYAKECVCMTVYKNKLRIKKSGLSKILNDCTFSTYKTPLAWQEKIKATAQLFLEQENKWFYIGGAVGSGKTHICTAICAELIKKYRVYYMQWRDEIVAIKTNVMDEGIYQDSMRKLKDIDVLYIDDFFKGKYTEADINIAFELLNFRYSNKMITIISSEKTVNDILEIDAAVGSRIYQMSKGFEVTVYGTNKNVRLMDDMSAGI